MFWSLFEGLQKTKKPSHEKTPKGHLSHKSIEILEVDMFLKGFLVTFWKPRENHKAQPRKNTKRAPEPQKHQSARSWHVFEMFSVHFLKASKKPWSPATDKHKKGTWACLLLFFSSSLLLFFSSSLHAAGDLRRLAARQPDINANCVNVKFFGCSCLHLWGDGRKRLRV